MIVTLQIARRGYVCSRKVYPTIRDTKPWLCHTINSYLLLR